MNNEFKNLTEEFNKKILEMYKVEVMKAVEESKKEKLDEFYTYMYILDCLNAFTNDLGESIGLGSNCTSYPDMDFLPFTEELQLQILSLTDKYCDDAVRYYESFAKYVEESSSTKELFDKTAELNKLFEETRNRDVDGIFADVKISSTKYDGRFDSKNKTYKKNRKGFYYR